MTLQPNTLNHIAIIMDGNGRWARQRGLPRTMGHARGADAVERAVQSAIRRNIPYLTLFGFSAENWARPEDEVSELMALLRRYLKTETASMHKNNIRLRFIGDRSRFAPDIIALLNGAEETTRNNTALHLTVALNYGGRQEILRAVSRLMAAKQNGQPVDESQLADFLDTADLPDPDLIIRTSGEKRISNFLLWQLAYAEFEFIDALWPDFSDEHMAAAIDNYYGRERRFGMVKHG